MYIIEVNFFISMYIPKFISINPMHQNSVSFQARFHTARRDDKGLATSITTWRQTKVEAEAGDEEGAGGDDVETGHEDAAGDEGEAGDVKALTRDMKGDGAAACTGEEDEDAVRARAEDEGEASRPPEDEDEGAAR